jgi:chromosome segregation ATPase
MNRDPRQFPPRRVPRWELPRTTDRVMNLILELQSDLTTLRGDLDDANTQLEDERRERESLARELDEHDTRLTELESPA